MLSFQKAAFVELATVEPGGVLLVMASGLGLEDVCCTLAVHFAHPTGLVLALGLPDHLADRICTELSGDRPLPFHSLDAHVPPLKRQETYLLGGVISCTARVLLLDLLQERLSPDLVSGLVIFEAEHRSSEHGMDAFCLDLICSRNKQVFVRALSERPEQLSTGGFGRFERALRALHCNRCVFFPRFHQGVAEELNGTPVDVVEVKVSLGREARTAQALLLDLLQSCLRQLLQAAVELDPEDYPLDAALLPGFEARLLAGLGGWRGGPVGRLLGEIRTLKALLEFNLLAPDREAFRDGVDRVLAECTSGRPEDHPGWVSLDATELLRRSLAGSTNNPANPKLAVVNELVSDVTRENPDAVIVIVTSSETMFDLLLEPEDKRLKGEQQQQQSIHHVLYDGTVAFLQHQSPSHVIVCDLSVTLVRQIEVHQALHPAVKLLHVYYLMYIESSEEQRFLTTLRRERDAFERLIKLYGDLPQTLETTEPTQQQQQQSTATDSSRFSALLTTNTGDGLDQDQQDSKDVLVDVRELRSALPHVLYRRGFRIIPLTLDTGDYIVADGVAVERKTIDDLLASLNSGRLLAQTERLLSAFDLSVLLIELDGGRRRSPWGYQSTSLTVGDPLCKLALLLQHRPTLRLLWSFDPSCTVDMFSDLKRRRPAPRDGDGGGKVYNGGARNVLLSSRCVDETSVSLALDGFRSLRDLWMASREALSRQLGAEIGGKMWRMLTHHPHS